MSYPIWLQNMLFFVPLCNRAEALEMYETIFTGACMRWLDRVMVRGNEQASAAARVMLDHLDRFADFSGLRSRYPQCAACQKRLRGLV